MTCIIGDGITLCRAGAEERRVYGRTKKRWCFKCRARYVHDKVIYTEILRYDEKGELINGYYEPRAKYECRNCGGEHLEFAT